MKINHTETAVEIKEMQILPCEEFINYHIDGLQHRENRQPNLASFTGEEKGYYTFKSVDHDSAKHLSTCLNPINLNCHVLKFNLFL